MRELFINGAGNNEQFQFASNYIKTTKYTLFNFLPLSIFYQYMRLANCYFLMLCIMSLIPSISPWTPAAQIVPSMFVLMVSIIREGIEDFQRFRNDTKINRQIVQRIKVNDGGIENIKSFDIKVGDMLLIKDDEEFPSDMVLIDSSIKGDSQWSQTSMVSIDGTPAQAQNQAGPDSSQLPNQPIMGPNNVQAHCFIQTSSLDGEKNLKKRLTPKNLNFQYKNNQISNFVAKCTCDEPNSELYQFNGTLKLQNNENEKLQALEQIDSKKEDPNVFSLNENQLMLKGAKLLNTKWIVGFVVYSGNETKLMQNQQKVRFKQSKLEIEMNKTVSRMFVFHILACIVLASAAFLWNDQYGIYTHYLDLESVDIAAQVELKEKEGAKSNLRPNKDKSIGQDELIEKPEERLSPLQTAVISCFTYFLLNSTFIPVSLIVTIELVKIIQSYFISKDAEMYCEIRDQPCKVNTASLNEELGQVGYVFTDKTGTLTRNLMEFKLCKIGSQIYGDQALIRFNEEKNHQQEDCDSQGSFRSDLKKQTPYNVQNKFLPQILFDHDYIDSARCNYAINSKSGNIEFEFDNQNKMIAEFLKALSVAHQCMPEKFTDESNKTSYNYQGPSPDEIALVEMAQAHGYEYIYGSEQSRKIRRKTQDLATKEWHIEETVDFKVFRIIEFNSDRKRMSILVQDPTDGYYKLYCKGADSIIKERLNMSKISDQEIQETDSFLRRASLQGFRTLLIAMRVLDAEEVQELLLRFQEAEQDLENRQMRLDEIYDEIERELFIIGATVVEDRLQDDVKDTIASLHQANIKVWMLTGDKLETAESIGYSTKLLMPYMDIIKCASPNDAWANFNEEKAQQNENMRMLGNKRAIIIEATALKEILEDNKFILKRWFLKIARSTETVICCRVSPSQKAEVVRLIRQDDPDIVTLAIGDGANDVSMILEADIGVGIFGNEGMRAVDTSDFAIAQFKFLWHLIFKHGRWNYMRMSELIGYFFYKNFIYTVLQLLFSSKNGFSGSTVFPDWFLTFYNMFFTALPISIKAILDQDIYPVEQKDGEQFKQLIPQLYYQGQRSLLYNQLVFYWWMFIGSIHSWIIFYICKGQFINSIMEHSGDSTDMWTFSMSIFTSLIFVVTNKFMCITRTFSLPILLGIFFGTYCLYFAYLYFADELQHLVMQHFTFHRIFTSGSFYLTCLLPIMICLYIDLMIESIKMMIFPNPQSCLRQFLKNNNYGNNTELTEEFMNEFNNLSGNQYRLGLIEDFFREEELDQYRAYLASVHEAEEQNVNQDDRQAKYAINDKNASKATKSVIQDPNQQKSKTPLQLLGYLKTNIGNLIQNRDSVGNQMTRPQNNNMSRTLQRYGGLELKIPSRNNNQQIDNELQPAGAADMKNAIQLKSVNTPQRMKDTELIQIPNNQVRIKKSIDYRSDIRKSPYKDTNYLSDQRFNNQSLQEGSSSQNINEREIFQRQMTQIIRKSKKPTQAPAPSTLDDQVKNPQSAARGGKSSVISATSGVSASPISAAAIKLDLQPGQAGESNETTKQLANKRSIGKKGLTRQLSQIGESIPEEEKESDGHSLCDVQESDEEKHDQIQPKHKSIKAR